MPSCCAVRAVRSVLCDRCEGAPCGRAVRPGPSGNEVRRCPFLSLSGSQDAHHFDVGFGNGASSLDGDGRIQGVTLVLVLVLCHSLTVQERGQLCCHDRIVDAVVDLAGAEYPVLAGADQCFAQGILQRGPAVSH
ncbi:hypothetical protein BX281_10608 [Streptomyces sp. Ag82_O1-15]|nr:hypothetical protein BX281_10608 [Streptomyces sp. Ag82_O1-15]